VGALVGYLETQVASAGVLEQSDSEASSVRMRRPRRCKKVGKRPSEPGMCAERAQALQAQVVDTVSGVLGAAVDMEVPLMEAGLDSLGAVELRNALAQAVGMDLPGTMVFDYPTVGSLAGYLQQQASQAEVETTSEVSSDGYASSSFAGEDAVPVMIYSALCDGSVGAVGRYPEGGMHTEGLGVIPMSRWDVDAHDGNGPAPMRFMGFMQDIDRFDAQTFGISQIEAVQTDTQQRMLLMNVLTAMRKAGESMSGVRGTDRGVAVGIITAEYASLLSRTSVPFSSYTALQGVLSVACGRLSYTFGMTGPSYSIDTACSSSLVSSHLATKMVQSGETSSSASVGVQHFLIPEPLIVLMVSNMLAVDGRCKTLDQSANGYVRAEACGVLEMRAADEEVGVAIVHGSAVNQDGRSSSLTAPNGPSQQAVVRGSIECADVTLAQYEQHEMHGTGTALGDPIEVGAACAVLLQQPKVRRGPLTLSAAKITCGHAEAGAGVLGTVHSLTGLGQACSALLTNLRIVNPYVAETMGVAKLAMAPRESMSMASTQQAAASVSGISSFAFQGTNAHALIGGVTVANAPSARHGMVWDRQSLWLAPRAHTMVRRFRMDKGSDKVCMQSMFSSSVLSYLWDHRVNGRALLPGTGFMELSVAAARSLLSEAANSSELSLSGVSIRFPLQMDDRKGRDQQWPDIQFVMKMKAAEYSLQPLKPNASSYIAGHISSPYLLRESPAARDAVGRSAASDHVAGWLAPVTVSDASSSGVVDLGHTKGANSCYMAHPAAMDNCLQLSWGRVIHMKLDGITRVPAALGSLRVVGSACKMRSDVSTWAAPLLSPMDPAVSNFQMQDTQRSSGIAQVSGMEGRVMASRSAAPVVGKMEPVSHQLLYTGAWHATKSSMSPAAPSGKWLSIHAHNSSAVASTASIPAIPRFSHIEYLTGSQAPHDSTAVHMSHLLEVVHGALSVGVSEMHLRTRNSASVGHSAGKCGIFTPMESAAQGMLRAVGSETPNMLCVALDLNVDGLHSRSHSSRLSAGLAQTQRLHLTAMATVSGHIHLRPMPRGSLNGLVAMPGLETTDSASIPDFGVLRVHAVGVNFRDVLNVLGAYPGDPGPPGGDCAGVWAENFSAALSGEGAFGMAAGSMGTSVYAHLMFMPPKPISMSFVSASTTPTVFVTVQIALQSAMHVLPGESLLVHAAAGGIGLAALQMSGPIGCSCLGTAGGSSKRTLVRVFGAQGVVGSRDTRYVDHLACVDGGSFPGAVLNSLTSAGFLAASLSLLASHAAFVAIVLRPQ
jgi:3-oxoacyl-(acyl-carrier-protein) synthase/acyl carrier protein